MLNIKLATVKDIPIILGYANALADITNEFETNVTADHIERIITSYDHADIYLVMMSKKPIGYIAVQDTVGILSGTVSKTIINFYINDKYRSRGLGKETLTILHEAWLEDKQTIDSIDLSVKKDNKNAKRAYKKMGFERIDNSYDELSLTLD